MYKRKPGQQKTAKQATFKAPRTAASAAARLKVVGTARGFQRTSGYYGRYTGMGGRELKFHDIAIDDATIASAGTIQNAGSVALIGQGITESLRIGRKLTIKSINWRYTINLPELDDIADPGASDTVRIILYLDKQANGATALVTDILDTADYQSFNNLANKSRFMTLMDRTITMKYSTLGSHGFAADTFAQVQVLHDGAFFKKCEIPMEFSGVAAPAAITEVRSNNIGVLLISSNGVAGFNSNMRLRFSDS